MIPFVYPERRQSALDRQLCWSSSLGPVISKAVICKSPVTMFLPIMASIIKDPVSGSPLKYQAANCFSYMLIAVQAVDINKYVYRQYLVD